MSSDGEEIDDTTNEKIIIGTKTRRGRKCFTQVKNVPAIFDYERILKYWRKHRQCNGSLKEEEGKNGEKVVIIELNGDHRDWIEQFLVYMGICQPENIRKQGKDNT